MPHQLASISQPDAAAKPISVAWRGKSNPVKSKPQPIMAIRKTIVDAYEIREQRYAIQARWHLCHASRSFSWREFGIHIFLALTSFWSRLGGLVFFGPLGTGLVFFGFCFGTPGRPKFLAFWFLLWAARNLSSWSRCSHL